MSSRKKKPDPKYDKLDQIAVSQKIEKENINAEKNVSFRVTRTMTKI